MSYRRRRLIHKMKDADLKMVKLVYRYMSTFLEVPNNEVGSENGGSDEHKSHERDKEKMADKNDETPKIDEKRLEVLGTDPTISDSREVNLHADIVSRWQFWLTGGLKSEVKEELLKKYPRKGNILLDPPEVNPVMLLSMSEQAIKRDEHFQDTERLAGSALSALGSAMNLLLEKTEEQLDVMKLFELLSDAGQLITDLHHTETVARRAFIAPGFSKSVKTILDKTDRGKFLLGDNITEKINEASSLEKLVKTIKPSTIPRKAYNKNSNSLNSKSSSTKDQGSSGTSNNQKSRTKHPHTRK